jgi:hypothetical protein
LDAATVWKDYFARWPAEVPRAGVLVTTFDEQIPFDGFATSENMLLVDRRNPDTLGARKILLTFDAIAAVKIVDVVKIKAFAALGFQEPRTKKSLDEG